MNEIEELKSAMKRKRSNTIQNKKENVPINKYVNALITRTLLAVIIFFVTLILTNTTSWGKNFVEETVLKENLSLGGLANLYDKYFGSIVPFDDIFKGEEAVFDEKLAYESIQNYKEGYELQVKKNYLVPIINSGIVVFIGEKEGYGNTIIVQGIDEVDYWYANVTNPAVSLYDYVSSGSYLGTVNGEKLYLVFKKGHEFLEYDQFIS